MQLDENVESKRDELKQKLRQHFDGKIVRKDLTKKIKEGANVNWTRSQGQNPDRLSRN